MSKIPFRGHTRNKDTLIIPFDNLNLLQTLWITYYMDKQIVTNSMAYVGQSSLQLPVLKQILQ